MTTGGADVLGRPPLHRYAVSLYSARTDVGGDVNRRLLMTIALAALQLFAALPVAHGSAAEGRRASMTQGGKKPVQRRAADALTPGVWGGEHIRFEVTESGARVE